MNHRRVVTGLDSEGRSCVVIDGPIPRFEAGVQSARLVWTTETSPADNSGSEDAARPYVMERLHSAASNFTICEFPPHADAFMHATDTIDYLVVLKGQVTLVLETGEAALAQGDFVVDRGVLHGWRNDHDEPCICAVVNLPAHPVGNGRTV